MYQLTNVKVEPLTIELAKEIATMPGLPGERPVNRARMNYLTLQLDRGGFASPAWAVAVDGKTGTKFRINGQHSSRLLADLAPDKFPGGLLAHIEYWAVDEIADEAPDLFNLFDHPRSARSNTDYMGTLRIRHSDLAAFDNKFLVNVAAGIAENTKERWRARAAQNLPSADLLEVHSGRELGLYYVHEDCRRFAVWLRQFVGSMHAWMIARSGIVSEMLDDWQENAELAAEYWGFIFRENHPDFSDDTREFAGMVQKLVGKPKSAKPTELKKRAHLGWTRFRKLRDAEIAAEKAKGEKTVTDAPAPSTWVPPAAAGGEAQPGL